MSSKDAWDIDIESINQSEQEQEVLNKLVNNGFDFLKKAIAEFENEPKYSIIHFHASFEIFLKARLFMDDWKQVMVVKKDKNPSWHDLINGNFSSVGGLKAIKLINSSKAINRSDEKDQITKPEKDLFEKLGKHRNKLVHFYSDPPTSEMQDDIFSAEYRLPQTDVIDANVKLMLRCWHLLDRLITGRWGDRFQRWNNQVAEIRASLGLIKDYLSVKADELKPEIDLEKEGGAEFLTCPSCSYDMLQVAPETKPIFIPTCRLCDYAGQVKITIDCETCQKGSLEFIGEGFGSCNGCNATMGPEGLLNRLDELEPNYHNSDEHNELANCSQCSISECVFPFEEKFLCTHCFVLVNHLEQCDHCLAFNVEIEEGSGFFGCSACDGKDIRDRD